MNHEITIYGVMNKAGEVVYIGQTRAVESRRKAHQKRFADCSLVELAQCDQGDAHEVEQRVIQQYRQFGQAGCNRITGEKRGRSSNGRWRALSVTLEENEFWRFREYLVKMRTNFQDWASEQIKRSLEKAA